MFTTNVSGRKAFPAEQKIRAFKKGILKVKTIYHQQQ